MNSDETSRAARETFNKSMGTGAETVQGIQDGLTRAVQNASDLNLRLIDMAQANSNAAFALARDLAAAKKPSDFIEAWTAHTTKHFEMLTKQTSELTSLGQRFANSTAESATHQASERGTGH